VTAAHFLRAILVIAGIATALIVSPDVRAAADAGGHDPVALWALLPLGMYAVLALAGMRILPATLAAFLTALCLALPSPSTSMDMLAESVTNPLTVVGLVIALGGGLGAVLRKTGIAQVIVSGVLTLVHDRGMRATALGIMAVCAVAVVALGTLAGAIAVAAPLLIPVAARLQFTRIATAVMFFIGGCAGLAVAPFAGSNVAVMTTADIGFPQYLMISLPLAVVSLVVGMFWVPVVQRRGVASADFYTDEEAAETVGPDNPSARRSTAVFAAVLGILVIGSMVANIGITFPLIALPLLAIVAGISARLPVREWLSTMSRGIASVAGIWLLFWILALGIILVDSLHPFEAVGDLLRPHIEDSSPFGFAVTVALVGWVGLPGAAAVQVVLVEKMFGQLGAGVGLNASTWATILFFSSKADSYGPFPTQNMLGPMGMARSRDVRTMLLTGWVVLVPVIATYAGLLYLQTR